MKKQIILSLIVVLLISGIAYIAYGGVAGSRHDLSYFGGSKIWNYSPCIYCHTPHFSNTDSNFSGAPLWNKSIASTSFTPYSSPTMYSTPPGTPSGVSLACLSCHDGVVDDAHNFLHGSFIQNDEIACSQCHRGDPFGGETNEPPYTSSGIREAFIIGHDLSNDHPISMPYPYPANPELKSVADVTSSGLRLFYSDNRVECASCHDPHDPTYRPFLRKSNQNSDLCLTCHIK